MALNTAPPADLPTTDSLAGIPDDLLGGPPPPAHLRLGTSPAAMEDPPSVGDTVTYCVRTKCTGQHGPLVRNDGEMRYARDLSIQAIWKLGDPEPPDADADQPALFDHNGETVEGEDVE